MLWFRRRKRPEQHTNYTVRPTRNYARLIADTDLSLVRQKAAGRHGWTDKQAEKIEADYRYFLWLMATNPRQQIVPWNQDLDDLWHEHILDTKRYADDCQRIFGYFIHHDPHIGRSPTLEAQARRATEQLRRQSLSPAVSSAAQSDSSLAWLVPAMMLTMSSPAHAEHDGNHGGGPADGWSGGSTHDASAPAASCSSAPASSCGGGGASCSGGGGGGCGGGGS